MQRKRARSVAATEDKEKNDAQIHPGGGIGRRCCSDRAGSRRSAALGAGAWPPGEGGMAGLSPLRLCRPDRERGGYYADHYYRDGRYYKPRRLGAGDRIYRGRDGRYYCRRADGTTGLIIGGIAGGLLGNTIAPGGSKTLGTLLGGGAGALLGRSIDRDNVTCR